MRQTKEEFVERAIKKHGVWYDYSKVEYVNAHTKVLIICPDHGEFWQTPTNHLSGHGCPQCGQNKAIKNRTKTQEEIIKEFRGIHGEWYDYSKVVYVDAKTKVCIICPIHGEFWQTPDKHLSGQGCPKCANKNVTKEEFAEKSIQKHGEWYDYSKVEYINGETKVLIICPDHGEFWQTPGDHLSGRGCPKCGGTTKLTKEDFVEKSMQKHGVWYDYSKVEYVNAHTKVLIICPNHGEFWQRPYAHLSGQGCPHCKTSILENSVNKILTNNNINFIQNYKGFDWLKNVRNLELDFYLPEYNIGVECQGEQHFISVEYFGGEEGLQYIQANDNIKKQLCEEHNLRLFYINYNDNIEKKMEEIICYLTGKYLEQSKEKFSGDSVT
jgi:ssDNA-binding Zn-finger/Zn-ribbon topoisomerase 1